tara:strand:- start:871 stop:1137 length:267 start_codon:yes stop_codon:yes gene_type:complete
LRCGILWGRGEEERRLKKRNAAGEAEDIGGYASVCSEASPIRCMEAEVYPGISRGRADVEMPDERRHSWNAYEDASAEEGDWEGEEAA